MKQGLLAFQYEQEKGSTGMTGLSGLMTYLELMQAAGLRSSVERHVRLRERGQGWTDSQMIISLMLLNLAGGESVSDLDLLEKDRGLCRMFREFETCGMRLSERRALEKRWRVERRRSVPSESAVFRYLERFHDAGEESMREAHRAFIPAPNGAMKGLRKVNADLVGFAQSRSPQTEATLDMDATLVETRKQEALPSYKKYRAYQPLITYWSEAELIVHSEFRDGNVPAGHQQLRVLIEALGRLPAGVEKVMLRSDTAGYQRELLRYCAEGGDERFGVIEFAVGVDVTTEFRRAVSEVAEQDWQTLYRKVGEHRVDTGQQWADVNFMPNWIGYSKNSPEYRFIATRERLIEQPLPGMEGQMELPFPAMELSNRGWYKVFGVVTNRSIAVETKLIEHLGYAAEYYNAGAPTLTFERVAITEEQIEDHGLPTKPVKATQSRKRYDIDQTVEAEAMPPAMLREIVAGAFEPMVDQRQMMLLREVEAAERNDVRERLAEFAEG